MRLFSGDFTSWAPPTSSSSLLWITIVVHDTIYFLPDPIPGADGHYKTLEQLLDSSTDERHRPSLHTKAKWTKTLPFTPSVQHVKMSIWCCSVMSATLETALLTSQTNYKLTFRLFISDVSFISGAQIQDLNCTIAKITIVSLGLVTWNNSILVTYYYRQ